MSITSQTKRLMLKYLENFLFFLLKIGPFHLTLHISRLMRKLLLRENIIEKKVFKDFQEYKDFVQIAVKNHKDKADSDNCLSIVTGKKIFFICCDGNENKNKKTPATFLDVWRDTALEAGNLVKVSIANEFMYDVTFGSVKSKNKYVNDVINEINTFNADLIFFDTNYLPTDNSLNPKDVAKIKTKTKVPIYGHTGDFNNEDGVKSAQVWLSDIDRIFHGNIEMIDLNINRLHYVPYTCSVGRYYPEQEKDISIFFSGVANIPRLWYLLKASKFANSFLPNPRINFFKSSERLAKSFFGQDQYDSLLRRSYSILDLTHRSRLIQTTSGRMFQALASETVVLAEECKALNKLLKPFVEYLPFRNGIELEYGLTLLRDEPELCKSIAMRGLSKFKRNHSPEKIWYEILSYNKIKN